MMQYHAAWKKPRGPHADFSEITAVEMAGPEVANPAVADPADFGGWLDAQLEGLEQRWSHFCTHRSIMSTIKR